MRKPVFSRIRIVLIPENTGQKKPHSGILCAVRTLILNWLMEKD